MSTTFACLNCYDTQTIDFEGRVDPCPACAGGTTTEALVPLVPTITVEIRGLSHGLGDNGPNYATATEWTSSRIRFQGTRAEILADVRHIRARQVREVNEQAARGHGYKGRNHISSWAISIEKHVVAQLARI